MAAIKGCGKSGLSINMVGLNWVVMIVRVAELTQKLDDPLDASPPILAKTYEGLFSSPLQGDG